MASQKQSISSRWVCPTDRNLLLRAKLNSGWSSLSTNSYEQRNYNKITTHEIKSIQHVLQRANRLNLREKQRINTMINRVQNETKKNHGSGIKSCYLCGDEFKKFSINQLPTVCIYCKLRFCKRCCSENLVFGGQLRKEEFICRICCEKKELIKRSGAWFYKGLPPFLHEKEAHCCLSPVKLLQTRSYRHHNHHLKHHNRNSYLLESYSSSSSIESLSEDVATKTNSSVEQSNNKKNRSSIWKRKVEVPLIKKIKFKKALERKSLRVQPSFEITAESPDETENNLPERHLNNRLSQKIDNSNLLSAHKHGSHISLSSLSSFESDYDMMYYDADNGSACNSSLKCDSADNSSQSSKKEKFGYLVFSLLYDKEKCVLQVKVIKAKQLKAMDIIGSSDPYVKIYLVPGNKLSTRQRTKVVRRNVNPVFNETLVYSGITSRDVKNKRVILTVKDHDRIGKDDFLGELEVSLCQLESGRPRYFDLELGRKKVQVFPESEEDARVRGRCLINLMYNNKTHFIEVRVPILTGLVIGKRKKSVNLQCQAVLSIIGDRSFPRMVSTSKTERRKTTGRNSNLIVFAEELKLPLPSKSLKNLNKCALDIAVWDKDSFGKETLIGAVHFSINSRYEEQVSQWTSIAEVPCTNIEHWHKLLQVENSSLTNLLYENRK